MIDGSKQFVMAGLDPATQSSRGSASENALKNISARTDVRALGGRVKPGHDEA